MMSVPLHRETRERGCQIKMAVRRPCQRPSSPPHDTVTDDGEVIARLFPDVKDDLREAARQRDPRDFLPPPLLHRMKPSPQGPGPTDGRGRGEDQDPPEQAIAFLRDVAGANPTGTAADARGQADVAGDPFGAREALDVPELEDEHNRNEGADAGMVVKRRTRGSAPQRVTRSASRRRICASSVGNSAPQSSRIRLGGSPKGSRCNSRWPRCVSQLWPEVGCRLRRASIACRRLRITPRSQTSWMRWRMSSRASRRVIGGIQTLGRRSPRSKSARRSASTRSFLRRAAAIAFVCFGFESTGWCPSSSRRSTSHHQVPEASIAMGVCGGRSAKNFSSRAASLASRCCTISPSSLNTAICELCLSRSTPTCTILLASCLREVYRRL